MADPAEVKAKLRTALRDFRLSGIDLPAEQQKRYGEIQMKLSELASKFSNQLLDATQAWTKHITDEALLNGLTGGTLDLSGFDLDGPLPPAPPTEGSPIPASVSRSLCPSRSQSLTRYRSSKRRIAWLTADCVKFSRSAA